MNLLNFRVMVILIVHGALENVSKKVSEIAYQRKNRGHLDCIIVDIG